VRRTNVGEGTLKAVPLVIEFDNRQRRDAGEVDDRALNDDLTMEIRTFQFQLMAQRPPKAALRFNRRFSHCRGAFAKLRINVVADILFYSSSCIPPPAAPPR
jgi:hypothetical protein